MLNLCSNCKIHNFVTAVVSLIARLTQTVNKTKTVLHLCDQIGAHSSVLNFQFSNSSRNCWATWRLMSRVSLQPSPGYLLWPCGCKCPRGTSSVDWPAADPRSTLRTNHRPHSRCKCSADQSPLTFHSHWPRPVPLTSPPCSRRPPPQPPCTAQSG